MLSHIVTTPTGEEIHIDAPDDATDEDILGHVHGMLYGEQPSTKGIMVAGLLGGSDAASVAERAQYARDTGEQMAGDESQIRRTAEAQTYVPPVQHKTMSYEETQELERRHNQMLEEERKKAEEEKSKQQPKRTYYGD